jgi:GH24 family phage-related lysozyme (muramidase)
MNTPAPNTPGGPIVWIDPPPPAPKSKKGPAIAVGLIIAGVLSTLLPDEGRKLTPYRDSAGIWTVCMGITGPEVWRHKGTPFTADECKGLETAYVGKMVSQMQPCLAPGVADTLTLQEWIAYGHFGYNTGTSAWCHSTIVAHLNVGKHEAACNAMSHWTYITVHGQKVNCRTAGHLCPGIVKRRDKEVAMCLDAL